MLGTAASNTVTNNNSRGGRGLASGGADRTDGTSQNNSSGVSRLGLLDRGGLVGEEELGMPLLSRRLGDESSSNVPREADV